VLKHFSFEAAIKIFVNGKGKDRDELNNEKWLLELALLI
jgi:hypothetical protein